MTKALVLFSGGADSTTLLYYVKMRMNYDDVYTISFDYGQRHSLELLSVEKICKELNVPNKLVRVSLNQLGSTPLTNKEIPVPNQTERKQSKTVVYGRNSIFLSMAAGYAEANGIDDIFYCPTLEDFTNYRDCRPEFVSAMSVALSKGNNIRGVYAPFVEWSKAEIIKIGLEMGVDYSKTHTCYNNQYPPCRTCDSCVERINAFKKLGLEDPLLKSKR
jgi:7-cyano-7-deazaguanine synthase